MDDDCPRPKPAPRPGPRSLAVPSLGPRLDLLLMLNGRNQKWLASCLGVTESAVANWKQTEAVPALRAMALCRLLGVTPDLLQTPELSDFETRVRDAFAAGGGRSWRALLNSSNLQAPGLVLRIEGGTRTAPALRAVLGTPPLRAAPTQPKPRVVLGQRLRFALSLESLPRDLRADALRATVMFYEDPHGLACLCPSPRYQAFAPEGSTAWVLPRPDLPSFYVDVPCGDHVAYAVVPAVPIPDEIRTALMEDKVLRAADRMAVWLRDKAVPHLVLAAPFFLSPS